MDVVTTEIHVLVSGERYYFSERQIEMLLHGLECVYEQMDKLVDCLVECFKQVADRLVDLSLSLSATFEPIVDVLYKKEEVVFVPSVFEHYFDTYHKFFGYKSVTPRPLKYTPYLARRY